MADSTLREDVVVGLIAPLGVLNPVRLARLRLMLSQATLHPYVGQFADRVPEAVEVCDFLPLVASIKLVPIAQSA